MILMAKVRYPTTSAKDFSEKAIEELRDNPYPEFTKGTYYFKFGDGGIVMYVIYEITPGNEDAAIKDINERAFKFSQQVKGWEPATMEILMSIEETLAMLQSGALPS